MTQSFLDNLGYENIINIINKKIEHLQSAIKYIEASCENDLLFLINKLKRKIGLFEKHKRQYQKEWDAHIKMELESR